MIETQYSGRRKKFGLLVSTINGVYQSSIWKGISEFAKKGGYDLVSFIGRELDHPVYNSNDYNYIYNLALSENLDGLFCTTTTICNYVNTERAEQFIAPFRKFPIVNIGHRLPGIPCVQTDNFAGMSSLMDHYLEFHQYRRIAFLRGPTTNNEAEIRYQAYCDALNRHGIKYDPHLVHQGRFNVDSGMSIGRQILGEGPLPFDCIVSANDDMALGILTVFNEAGLEIPRDIAIAGFDDVEEIRLLHIPMTSVRQDYDQICNRAGELMLDLIAGKQVPEHTGIPATLMVRESCGCSPLKAFKNLPENSMNTEAIRDLLLIWQRTILSPEQFITELNSYFSSPGARSPEFPDWHFLINEVRTQLTQQITDPKERNAIESTYSLGNAYISRLKSKFNEHDVIFHKDLILGISDFIQNINFGLNEDATLDALPLRLMNLKINGFALVTYPDAAGPDPPGTVVLKRTFNKDGCFREMPAGLIFPSNQALPSAMVNPDIPHQFLCLPIVNHGLKFGWCCFVTSATHHYIYGVVQEQLGILLNREHLAREIIQKRTQELVETEKMAALRMLVAGIAHEINTPIGTSFTAASFFEHQTSDLIEAFKNNELKKSDLEEFLQQSKEITGILISNLGRTANLVQSFKKIAVDSSSGNKRRFQMKEYAQDIIFSLSPQYRHLKLEFIVECPASLEIDSFPGAIAQIMTNLVENSIIHAYPNKQSGKISNSFQMDNGTLIWTYSDDGLGMPPDILTHVFEPFFTTRRTTGGSGLGLHVVYNLVTQQFNGTITCASTEGQGASFTIRIPLDTDDIHYG